MNVVLRLLRWLLVVVLIGTAGGFVRVADAALHLQTTDDCCPRDARCPAGGDEDGCPPLCNDCVRPSFQVVLTGGSMVGLIAPPALVIPLEPRTRLPLGPTPPGVFHPPRR